MRAVTLSAVAVGVGSLAHAGACGPVRATAVAAVLVIVTAMSWCLARRELSAAALLTVLTVAQALTHVVLHAASAEAAVPVRHGGLMLAAHLLAVVSSAAALRAGEAGTWTARRLRRECSRLGRCLALRGNAAVLLEPDPDSAGWAAEFVPPAWRDLLLGGMRRRGPPAALSAG